MSLGILVYKYQKRKVWDILPAHYPKVEQKFKCKPERHIWERHLMVMGYTSVHYICERCGEIEAPFNFRMKRLLSL